MDFLTGSHQKEFVHNCPYKTKIKLCTFPGDKEEAAFVSSFFIVFALVSRSQGFLIF